MLMKADTEALVKGCKEETTRFLRHEPGLRGYCLELFRRAIVEGSQEAWEAIVAQYRRQMLHWAGAGTVDADDLVQDALHSFLKAVTSEVFARFMGIPKVLAYLRRCVISAKIDRQRGEGREQPALAKIALELDHQGGSPEHAALDKIVNRRAVEYIYSRLNDEQERLVVRLNLELGYKPKEIVHLHPAEFPTARDVYTVRERVVRRLSQDPILRYMLDS